MAANGRHRRIRIARLSQAEPARDGVPRIVLVEGEEPVELIDPLHVSLDPLIDVYTGGFTSEDSRSSHPTGPWHPSDHNIDRGIQGQLPKEAGASWLCP